MFNSKLASTLPEQLPIRTINFSDPSDKSCHDRMVNLAEQMIELHKKLAAAQDGRGTGGSSVPDPKTGCTAAGDAISKDAAQTQVQRNLITFNGRYDVMTYDGYHFSQLGRIYNLGITYRF